MKPGNSKVKTNSISQIHYIIADYEIKIMHETYA